MATKTKSEKTENRYSYRQQGNRYVLYCNGKVHRQPVENGRIVSTTQKELAAKLVEALERGESYRTADSLLFYHYAYCDIRNVSLGELRKELCDMTDEEYLDGDFYEGFGQKLFGVYYGYYWSQRYLDEIKNFNRYQVVAIEAVGYYCDSYIMPMLIVEHIVRKMKNKNYRTVKREFLDKMDDYFCEKSGMNEGIPDFKVVAAHRRRLSKVIDKFVYYFNLK